MVRSVVGCQLLVASAGPSRPRARTANCQPPTANCQRLTAFTLTEVMFAVILLGIGFIMVAAMFPVAIQQNRTTAEQTAATQLARTAVNNLQQVAASLSDGDTRHPMEQTQGNVRMNDRLWNRIEGSLINPDDPRYAWTALYAREAGAQFAQVFVFTLQARNRSAFLPEDTKRIQLDDTETYYPANLEPRPVLVRVKQADPVDQILIGTAADDLPWLRIHGPSAAVENAFVVIANGEQRGRVLRLGRPINRADGLWELAPGSDLPHATPNIPREDTDPPAEAYIIGRGYNTTSIQLPGHPPLEGPAMDIMIFTGFVRVRQ